MLLGYIELYSCIIKLCVSFAQIQKENFPVEKRFELHNFRKLKFAIVHRFPIHKNLTRNTKAHIVWETQRK